MEISNRGAEDEKKMEGRSYIRWDDSGVEKKSPGEDEDIQTVADMINAIQKAQYNNHRHCYSGKYASRYAWSIGLDWRSQELTPEHKVW